jgi:hypothetical protein
LMTPDTAWSRLCGIRSSAGHSFSFTQTMWRICQKEYDRKHCLYGFHGLRFQGLAFPFLERQQNSGPAQGFWACQKDMPDPSWAKI